jgi:hypothetical protein
VDAHMAARAANHGEVFRAEMIGSTEVATAMSAGRATVYKAALPILKGSDANLEAFKVWCSALEKNTCDRCARAHGEIRPIAEAFSLGQPGGVHPRCLCWDDVIWVPRRMALAS